MSLVTCDMSHVVYHTSCVTCDISHVMCNIFFLFSKGLSYLVLGLLSTGPTPASFYESWFHFYSDTMWCVVVQNHNWPLWLYLHIFQLGMSSSQSTQYTLSITEDTVHYTCVLCAMLGGQLTVWTLAQVSRTPHWLTSCCCLISCLATVYNIWNTDLSRMDRF